MPFDGTPKPDLSVPSLEGLSYALRQQMPEGFRWDFGISYQERDCGTVGCAYGLAQMLWPQQMARLRHSLISYEMAELLKMTQEDAYKIFSTDCFYGKHMPDITPQDVADAIDRYLLSKERGG